MNMSITNKQQIEDAFTNLPQVLQDAVTDADVQAKLRALADVHKLHLDKWTILEDEIMKGLLGITNIDELAQNIQEKVGLSSQQATEISNSVVKIVLIPIQDKLHTEVGESQSTLESIDSQAKPKIDITKFTGAPTEPQEYQPDTPKKYVANNDPYHESVE